MTTETPSTRTLTAPNVISFIRILGALFFWWLILVAEDLVAAGWLILVVGWTDWIDGYLARRLNQVSRLGKALDPIADRLMIASAVIGGLITGALPAVIGYPLIAREILMAGVTLYLATRGAAPLDVRWLGKAATFALYGAIPAFYVAQGETLQDLLLILAWVGSIFGLVLYWVVAVQYLGDARRNLADVESRSDPEED